MNAPGLPHGLLDLRGGRDVPERDGHIRERSREEVPVGVNGGRIDVRFELHLMREFP